MSYPFSVHSLHLGEEHLELLDGDRVGGEDAHQLDEEVDHEGARLREAGEEVGEQAGLRARLQISDGFAQGGREDGPELGLEKKGWSVFGVSDDFF